MQSSELLKEGLALMGLGMGFVFVFLTVLVVSMTLMSRLLGRYQPAPVAQAPRRSSARGGASASPDEETLAVISAAVHRYRMARRR